MSLFDPEESTTIDNTSIQLPINDGDWGSLPSSYVDAVPQYGYAKRALDSINIGTTVPDVDLMIVSSVDREYPRGNYPVQLGVLSLGAPDLNQSFSVGRDTPNVNGTFVSSYLYTDGRIPSYSFGMHIGSAAYHIPGSLMLGFKFQKDSSNTHTIDIKVPFALLNLTLDYPLVDRPTPYFPCMPTNRTYGLGRAFLQAAFVGVNWGNGVGSWFLAQCPIDAFNGDYIRRRNRHHRLQELVGEDLGGPLEGALRRRRRRRQVAQRRQRAQWRERSFRRGEGWHRGWMRAGRSARHRRCCFRVDAAASAWSSSTGALRYGQEFDSSATAVCA